MKTRQARQQPVGGKGEIGGHLQHLVGGAGGDQPHPLVQGGEPGLDVFLQQSSGFGEQDAAMDAIKQPHLQLGFQALDLLADGWLGGAQFARRRGKAQAARHHLEGAQTVQRQGRAVGRESGVQGCVSMAIGHKPSLSETSFRMAFTQIFQHWMMGHP